MPIVEPDDEAFVGIIPRAPNWTQRAIERRGPPPGNAETLIRGGASWVFGITPREELVQEAIVRVLNMKNLIAAMMKMSALSTTDRDVGDTAIGTFMRYA